MSDFSMQLTDTIIDLKMTAEKYRILKEFINKGQWWGKDDLNKFIYILENTPEAPTEEIKQGEQITNE